MTDPTAHYTVLARRFRPQTFEEVIGQDRIGRALRNAIQAGRVAHAYLFTGARGVGKTSTARIFAKALNCPNVRDAVPCNNCEVCQSIAAGHDVDVLEIDGASNRGIDDIRSLRANVTVRSMRSPYKVYIIDEVHMLTKEAFNALLKTLEEPPPNVKFVFCTTEPNKVPDTILSRCQRFDFGTIAPTSIVTRLRQIAEAEGVDVEEDALDLLARRAAGSMRDSQSLLDQLLAFGSDRITADDVHQLLGTAGDDRLIGLVDAIIARRRGEAIQSLDAAMSEGVQIGAFSDQLLYYLRDLLVIAADAETVPLESVSESQRPRLREHAASWGLRTIAAGLEILAATKARMQRVNYDRALLELAVIRLSVLEDLDSISAIIAGVQDGAGGAAAARTSPSTTSPTAPTRKDHSPAATAPTGSGSDPAVSAPQGPSAPATNTITSVVPSESAAEGVALTPGTIQEFWSQVIARLPDRLVGHLQNQDSLAISGPNGLEVSIPESYVLSRQFCERPETRRRMSEIATEIAGRPIEITIIGSQSPKDPPALKREGSQQGASSRGKRADIADDPFVQKALDIFGGTLIDTRSIHEQAGDGDGQ